MKLLIFALIYINDLSPRTLRSSSAFESLFSGRHHVVNGAHVSGLFIEISWWNGRMFKRSHQCLYWRFRNATLSVPIIISLWNWLRITTNMQVSESTFQFTCKSFTLHEVIHFTCKSFTLHEVIHFTCKSFTLHEVIHFTCKSFTLHEVIHFTWSHSLYMKSFTLHVSHSLYM